MYVPWREKRLALEVGHVFLKPAEKNGVFPGACGLFKDARGGEEVGLKEVKEEPEALGVALVGRGRQKEKMGGGFGEHLA